MQAFWTLPLVAIFSCANNSSHQQIPVSFSESSTSIKNISDIPLPQGYKRIPYAENTAAVFLRSLPLKKDKIVYLYNGEKKRNQSAQYAVLNIDVGNKDLQQCADAVMRLRAEYLWKQKRYEDIQFRFTNGFNCDYNHFREGYRLKLQGNITSWQKIAAKDYSYPTFRDRPETPMVMRLP